MILKSTIPYETYFLATATVSSRSYFPSHADLLVNSLLLSHHVQSRVMKVRGTMRRDEHWTKLLLASQVTKVWRILEVFLCLNIHEVGHVRVGLCWTGLEDNLVGWHGGRCCTVWSVWSCVTAAVGHAASITCTAGRLQT